MSLNHLTRCEIESCGFYRQKWGRYCEAHDRRNQRSGHPLGKNMLKGELRPYLKAARTFIREHQNHPGIIAALGWVTSFATSASPVSSRRRMRPNGWVANFRNRLTGQGVEPSEVLATVVAIYWSREFSPRRYQSDRHMQHQLALSVAKLAPLRDRRGWASNDVPVGVRDHLASILTGALGVLAMRIARELQNDRAQMRIPATVEGAHEPFHCHKDGRLDAA